MALSHPQTGSFCRVAVILVWLFLAITTVMTAAIEAKGVTNSKLPAEVCGSDGSGRDQCFANTTTLDNGIQEKKKPPHCLDQHERCAAWAASGECRKNPAYMLRNCSTSCNSSCAVLTEKEYGEVQLLKTLETYDRVLLVGKYMTETVFRNETFASIRSQCKNRDKMCTYWATLGECEKNFNFMQFQCAPACFSCEYLDFETRCPFDPNAPKVWNEAGDLDRFFVRLITNETVKSRYPLTVHSGPVDYTSNIEPSPADGPWIVALENFVSEAECQRLIELGHTKGYRRSLDVGTKQFDGSFSSHVNPHRTSTTAWCNGDCLKDPVSTQVSERISQELLLGDIPIENSEHLQLLRYEETQRYELHHDYNPAQVKRAPGVRILTAFMYLNDVPAGGGTYFPNVNLTVQPVRGRVVLWPSVLDEDPDAKDKRTQHEALAVEKGVKYGANAWIHQRDYATPHTRKCH